MDILKLFFNPDWDIQLILNKWILCSGVVLLVLWTLANRKLLWIRRKEFEINEAEIGVGSQKIKIKPNIVDMQIAYKLWVEMTTRKIGVKIDYENDVIVEVYDSWYEVFKITRELIKEIPVSKIRNSKDTQKLVKVATQVLNQGLRPHLTLWQAKFRKWYEAELENSKSISLTPQEIQKTYDGYALLTADMDKVNRQLMNYRDILESIFKGEN